MAVRRLYGGRISLTDISESLKLKKPTVSIAMKKLEDMGYIIKRELGDSNDYALTEKAWRVLEAVDRERFEFMTLFNERLGIDYGECDREYTALCGLFSHEFISSLAAARGRDSENICSKASGFCGITPGRYTIPFQVIQCGAGERSMGDRGFEHPAELVITEKRRDLLLRSRRIYYKSKNNHTLHGELSRLCYLNENLQWADAGKAAEDVWVIPLGAVMYQKDALGRLTFGIVKIKVEASTDKMPKSTAEITLNFKSIEQISE